MESSIILLVAALVAAIVGGVSGAFFQKRSMQTIKSKRIELIDDSGRTRILLEAGSSRPELSILGPDDITGINLGVIGLQMWRHTGSRRTERASILDYGVGSSFSACDCEGRLRATIGTAAIHDDLVPASAVRCWNDEGKCQAELFAGGRRAHLTLADDSGTALVKADVCPTGRNLTSRHHEGEARFIVFGRDKSILWRAPQTNAPR